MVVYEKSKENKELNGMGTTLDICLIYNNKAYIGHNRRRSSPSSTKKYVNESSSDVMHL